MPPPKATAQASVIELLESRADTLSKTQRMLARYVLANYQTVAFSTIVELAKLSGASEATIVRFAAALGFNGYPAFQRELRRVLRADLKAGERYALNRSTAPAAESGCAPHAIGSPATRCACALRVTLSIATCRRRLGISATFSRANQRSPSISGTRAQRACRGWTPPAHM